MEPYDSTPDTLAHIRRVQELLADMQHRLATRARLHDASKLEEPEKSAFDRATPRLKVLTYGSPDYTASLADMHVALEHHYTHNAHHPEHHPDGIAGMSLLDLLEMLCDWKAAGERHADGDIHESLRVNTVRYGIDLQLANILWRTIADLDEGSE